jgi:hypothetical protein
MPDLPFGRWLFYRYLGLAYAFTYWTSHKELFGGDFPGLD